MSLNQGFVQVYTGTGQCATYSSLGLAFRALGRGLRVFLIRFTKSLPDVGERFGAEHFGSRIQVRCLNPKAINNLIETGRADPYSGGPQWEEIHQAVSSGEHDLVILDGIHQAVDLNLILPGQVVDLIRSRSPRTEIVLTGEKAHPLILAEADLISEVVDPRPIVLEQSPPKAVSA